MKSKGLIVSIIIVATLLAFVLPWMFSHRQAKLGQLSFLSKDVSYSRAGKDNRDTYSIKATYPYFTAGFPDDIDQKVNDTILANIRTTALAVKSEFENQFGSEDVKNTYIPPEPLVYTGESEVSADLTKIPFVNITETGYQYSGGAHGITVVSTFVFDSRTGDLVTLPILFQGDYLNTLSKLALAELKRLDPELSTYTFANDGTLPDKENFNTFILKPDGIHFTFQDYQVAPYVAGEPEIVIPYSALSNVIAEKYKQVLK